MNLYFCRDIKAYWPLQNGLEYLFDLSKLLSEKNMFKPYTQKVKRAVSVYELWYCLIVQIFFSVSFFIEIRWRNFTVKCGGLELVRI